MRKQVRKIEIYFCEFNQFASCNHSLLPDPRIHSHLLLTLFCTSTSPVISRLPVSNCLKQFIHSILFIFSWCFPLPFKLLFCLIQFNICCHSHAQRLIMVEGEERKRKIKGWEAGQWEGGAGWGEGGAGGCILKGPWGELFILRWDT